MEKRIGLWALTKVGLAVGGHNDVAFKAQMELAMP